MIFHNYRFKSTFCLVVGLFFLGWVGACNNGRTDPKEELLNSLKGANVDGYVFATREDNAQVVTSLTNSAVQDIIKLDDGANNVVLRYTSVKDKNTNSTKIYKAEVVKSGTSLSILVTDMATGEAIVKETYAPPELPDNPDQRPTFDSLEACIQDFNCTRRGAILCEANRTCKNQTAALTCWLKNGQGFSVHLLIKPTSPKCLLKDLIPDLEGIVLRK